MSNPPQKNIPPRRTDAIDPVPELQRLLGPAVLIACPKRSKAPLGKWGHLRYVDMTPTHLAKLPGVNIGVALGEVSGGLVAIDIDADELVAPFLALNLRLADTFQTRGARGRVFWIRIKGDCPRSFKLKGDAGEFRADGNQSIVWGTHPSGSEYQWLVRKPAVEIAFKEIRWPDGIGPTDTQIQNNENARDSLLPPVGDVSKGELPKGEVSNGCPRLSMLGVGGVAGVAALSDKAKSEIERAVEFGVQSTKQNNRASFQACVWLIRLRGVENLNDMPPAERRYLAERWFEQLKSKDRITPGKSRTHYFSDIMNAIKNAKRTTNTKNPVPEAWLLAQTQPPPPEAAMFDDDKTMQRLIALCYQLHVLSGGGEWYLARDDAAELMGLGETEKRYLSDNFHVLVDWGILEIVSPYDKVNRKATIYRYIVQSHE